jgi:hypothetical protein
MEKFVNNLKSGELSQNQVDEVLNAGKIVLLKKGELFSQSGKLWSRIGILQTGIFCGWHIDDNADKKVSHIYYLPNNYLVVDYACFLKNTKSTVNIEAATDNCVLRVYDKDTINLLQQRIPNFLHYRLIEARKQYYEKQKLVTMFQRCNALERIKLVQQKAPEVLCRIPYSYIASFIGVHRNTFANAMKRM